MEYQVPQFIEVEDKIIGPFTLPQFIYLVGAIGLCAIFFAYLNTFIAVILSLPVAALGGALAFYKVNGKPFVKMFEAAFNYVTHARLLIWQKAAPAAAAAPDARPTAAAPAEPSGRPAPRLTRGKLAELAWSLDVKAVPPAPDSKEDT
jgi:hypothetical protein